MILIELAVGFLALFLVVLACIKLAEKFGLVKTVKSWFEKKE
jgi:hypothetical protein